MEDIVEFPLEPGAQRFENYELVKREDGSLVELGRGAMGVTYKAFDVDLRCPVALKVINEQYLADESVRLRFVREARAAAGFRHPNVASVFHLGRSLGNYFYAMELVEGETLERLIKRSGRIEVELALEIAAQIAAGLAAVHKQNLVHRDIKPTNIMVHLEEGAGVAAKIIDLGLAKATNKSHSETAITASGTFAGTPEFASPEQFAGVGLDIRSDLYSLGVTLWEMVAGQVPFKGLPAEIMYQHQHAALPVEQLKGVPQPVVLLLQMLLQKDPAQRLQSPGELLRLLPMIRDAVRAGRLLTKAIRVLVCSTADTQKERNLAERLIRTIAAQFSVPVKASYSNFQRLAEEGGEPPGLAPLMLCAFFLDDQEFGREKSRREEIPGTSEFDLVICILWSRLGPLLDLSLKIPDGNSGSSRTEHEIARESGNKSNLQACLIFRNCSKPTPPLEPKEHRESFNRQWDSLQDYFAHWDENREANPAFALKDYCDFEEFEDLFREHFRDFLARQVDREVRQEALSGNVRRWASNPFRGLHVFDFEHAPIFHGRTKAIGEVLVALQEQAKAQRPFLLVLGASGSGKSSLVRAGVLPLLTQPGTIEGTGLWRRAITRPGAGGANGDCFEALAGSLLEASALPVLGNSEWPCAIAELAAEFREHAGSVALRVQEALDQIAQERATRHSQFFAETERQLRAAAKVDEAGMDWQDTEQLELPKPLLALLVDQLEELFTAGFSSEIQQKYIAALAGLVRSGRAFVLATLRSDFYLRYQEFPELVEFARGNGKFDLRPPTAYEIGNMIRLPAEAAGLHFQHHQETGQRLDEALRDAASATPESLPLLEHVLSLLYAKQEARSDAFLRWSDYFELGELKGALAKHAEDIFSTLQSHEQESFRLVMRHLVTLGQGEEEAPNRRTAPYRDFVDSAGSNDDRKAAPQRFVDLFIENRLLIAAADPQGEVTVSVAHEALLREWQRVREWLTENREFLRMRGRLDSSLKLWLSRGQQRDDLLGPGLPIAEGEKLAQDFGSSLNREQTNYIHTSITERKRRKHAQARMRYALMAVISALAVIAGFQWLQAEHHRQNAENNAAMAQAEATRTKQALASEAEVAAQLQEQLRQASWASFNQAERQFQLGEWPEGMALLARAIKFDTQNQVASERFFQELIICREKAVPVLVASFAHDDVVADVAFSPDGTRILSASWDKTVKLWDAVSGALLASFSHRGSVWRGTFSPDGSRILTASVDQTARLWDVASRNLIATFNHEGAVSSAVFSSDGARILTASADRTAKLWDLSGKLIVSFVHQDGVNHAVFSPDGTRILTACADHSAKLWDAGSGVVLASFPHQDSVEEVRFSPDGAQILTASLDRSARLWDAGSGKLLGSFEHRDGVVRVAFSPDGTRILTVGWDGSAKLWDVASRKLIASFEHQAGVKQGVFSPDGNRVLTASVDKSAKLWDAASGKLISSFDHQDAVTGAAFSPDGAQVLTASADKTARLWNAVSGNPSASFVHGDEVNDAAFGPDGTRILTASADQSAKLWDAASGKLLASFFHGDEVNDAKFSPDGTRVLTSSKDKTAKLWDVPSGRLINSFVHRDSVYDAVFSPDGARVLTASKDKTARLWDSVSGKLIASFEHQDEVNDAAFSPDGARILTASADRTAKLWDAMSGKLIASFVHEDAVRWLAFSPDGTRSLTASADKTAKLWDTYSGKLIASFNHRDKVHYAAFSPDGARILTASGDGTAKLWDVTSGRLLYAFPHQDLVYYGAFSPDGTRILTASADKTAKLWDVASGKLVASFGHQDTVRRAKFSPDGTRILTASWDKTARIWDAVTPSEMASQVKESGARITGIKSDGPSNSQPDLQVLSEVASGRRFSNDGSLAVIDEVRRSELRDQLRNLIRETDPHARFIRWLFSTAHERTIFPASSVKISDWVNNCLLTNPSLPREWMQNALTFLPDNPLLHIALAAFESDSRRADFLRSFGLARLPDNSALCTRAAELLLEHRRPELALSAVDMALRVAPTDIPAQRLRLRVLDAMPR